MLYFFMQDTTFPVTLSVFVLPMKILRSHTEISRVSEDHTVVFGSWENQCFWENCSEYEWHL